MKSNPSERSTLDTGILYPFIESSCADSDHDALIANTTTPGYSGLSEIITFTHRKLITRPNFAILGPVHSKRQRERKRKRSKYKHKRSKNKPQRSKKIFVFASVFFFDVNGPLMCVGTENTDVTITTDININHN